jgi:hypothetical protein
VPGDQVGQAVGSHLVGDVEALVEILDRDVLAGLGVREHRGPPLARAPAGRRRSSWPPPAGGRTLEVDGVAVAEGEVPEGLGDHRPRRAHPTGQVALRDVDDPVAQVADRAGRGRQVLHPGDGEPEVGGQVGQVALRYRARPAIADRGRGPGGGALDLLEVVVALAHLVAHGRVGRPGTALPAAPGRPPTGGSDSSRTRRTGRPGARARRRRGGPRAAGRQRRAW